MVRHLYIHVPYCHRICPYCSFYKHTPGGTNHAEFVAAILAELRHHLASLAIRPRTIYLGGGTPTALSPTHLRTLLEGIATGLDPGDLDEWDIEANPATFDAGKAALMRDAGVTRVSLGVQSWTPSTLQTLGRDHSPAQAESAFHILREAGFPGVNIDMMFSVPGQTAESWRDDLRQTIGLDPDHISAYNLNYEEDTEFFERLQRGDLDEDEGRDAAMFSDGIELLGAAGFEHYEISNYAKPEHHSHHNAAYWSGADYLGLGPGAFSTIDGGRWRNLPDTAGYIKAALAGEFGAIPTEREPIGAGAFRSERIALELRTSLGVALEYLQQSSDRIEILESEGLVTRSADRLSLTAKGKFLADPIAAELI